MKMFLFSLAVVLVIAAIAVGQFGNVDVLNAIMGHVPTVPLTFQDIVGALAG